MPRRARQKGCIDLPQGVVVVAAEPACERNQVGREKRVAIDDAGYGLESIRGSLSEARDDADHFSASERHPHACADLRPGEVGGKRIVEDTAQGARHRDLDHWRGHRTNCRRLRRQAVRPGPMPIR